jgi:hypothetical protein
MECTVGVERKKGMRRMRAVQCIQPACISQQARGIVSMSVAPSARVSSRPGFFPEQHPIDSSEASKEGFPGHLPSDLHDTITSLTLTEGEVQSSTSR